MSPLEVGPEYNDIEYVHGTGVPLCFKYELDHVIFATVIVTDFT